MDGARGKNKINFKLWRIFWFLVIPTAALYQWSWYLYFQAAPRSIWVDGSSHALIATKLAGEALLYAIAVWFIVTRTSAKFRISKPITVLFLLVAFGFTVQGLILELLKL